MRASVSSFPESQCGQSCQPTTSGPESVGAGGAQAVRGLLHSELDADEIHLWYACLDQPAVDFRSLLSPDETIRAQRFHRERDRQRFIVRRGLLRTMLSGYLHADPGQLQFCCGRNGKPTMTDESGRKICFNLSHAEGLALYGFTRGREIGVDIERVRDVPDMDQIVERFFSPTENAALRTFALSSKRRAFFVCWTRKEALTKATGDGLTACWQAFDVSPFPDEPADPLRICVDSTASGWAVRDLQAPLGFAAAFAVQGDDTRNVLRAWPNL